MGRFICEPGYFCSSAHPNAARTRLERTETMTARVLLCSTEPLGSSLFADVEAI